MALFQNLDGLHHVVRRAYAACNQAVNDELARVAHASPNSQHATSTNPEPGHAPEASGTVPVKHPAPWYCPRCLALMAEDEAAQS